MGKHCKTVIDLQTGASIKLFENFLKEETEYNPKYNINNTKVIFRDT